MINWLEYLVEMDACFCYPCRMFGAQSSQFGSQPESTFTLAGFRDWKHAIGKMLSSMVMLDVLATNRHRLHGPIQIKLYLRYNPS